MPNHRVFVVIGLSILGVVVLAGASLYFSRAAPDRENFDPAAATTGVTDQTATVDGRCFPAVIIETLQHPDQRVGDLYQECTEQVNQKACLSVDRFHSDNRGWRPDGKSDCHWKLAPLADGSVSDYCSLLRNTAFRSQDGRWYVTLEDNHFSWGQVDKFPWLPGLADPTEGSYSCDNNVLQMSIRGSDYSLGEAVYNDKRDALIWNQVEYLRYKP